MRDVVVVGNALVDIIAKCDDDFLPSIGLKKASWTLFQDADALSTIASKLPVRRRVAGGAGANTAAGLRSFGSSVGFVGHLAPDTIGSFFRESLKRDQISFSQSALSIADESSGFCLVCVTPDGERTFLTHLGCSGRFENVDPLFCRDARYLFVEGYLIGELEQESSIKRAVRAAHESGVKICLSLSDPRLTANNQSAFLTAIETFKCLVFGNETEYRHLFAREDNFAKIIQNCQVKIPNCIVTRGEKGAIVISGGAVHEQAAITPKRILDTTGAGDAFVAGYLHGLCLGLSAPNAGKVGAFAASSIISHFGARPRTNLGAAASKYGIL